MRMFKLFFILIIPILFIQFSLNFFSEEKSNPPQQVITKPSNEESIIRIPYDFSGYLRYEDYRSLKERIFQFDQVTNIGKDESGNYNMYLIELGNKDKPALFIQAGMHGSEWQGIIYSMRFMEELRDGTFPDKALREKLLSEYHIVYVPVVNPWGYDRAVPNKLNSGRYNFSGIDLNRDFKEFTQVEAQNVKVAMDEFQPFAFLDIHMMQSQYEANKGNNIVLGNGQPQTNEIYDTIADSLVLYAEQPVTRWGYPNYDDPVNPGLARTYMRNQKNPYTPHTLSYIIELSKPVERRTGLDAPLENSEIMKYGLAGLYLFFRTSIMYYEEQN
jgi:hypothetical protein